MKVIFTNNKVITPSKDFIGKEHELAGKLGIEDYQIVDASDVPENKVEKMLSDIAALEGEITPRRQREALLTDAGKAWLAAKEAEIQSLRAEM